MGLEGSRLLSPWPPKVTPEIRRLIGWSRHDLCELFLELRRMPQQGVNLAEFSRLIKFDSRQLAEPIFELFHPHSQRVPYLSIIGPMVVMSDQHYISRASMLFCMFDFNNSGAVNNAEFFIGLRSLLKGCTTFWKNFATTSQDEVERISTNIFSRIDGDGSEFITMGEFLTFAYRSKDLRTLMSPHAAASTEIFEEPIYFGGKGLALDLTAVSMPQQLERKLRHQVRLTPDPPDDLQPKRWVKRSSRDQNGRRARAWRQPIGLTRAHAWVALRVFQFLAKGERTIYIPNLLQTLSDDLRAALCVEEALLAAAPAPAGAGGEPQDVAPAAPPVPEGVNRILQHFCLQFSGGHVHERVQVLRDDGRCVGISLRAFCCVVWPHISECDLEVLLGWCKAYQAQRTLHELMKVMRHEDIDLDAEDIAELFAALEGNTDGQLSADELHRLGCLDVETARKLVARLDADPSASLTKLEVRSVVHQLDTALKEQFRAASLMHPQKSREAN
mmetsp:Transcript_54296/g.156103  ORF Transcript_54296/g.156103 Transcript_54296/m.156103 type:complete len:502 (+) Transcript_54296:79-1584(+)